MLRQIYAMKHSSPLSDPLAEHGPEKEQGQQQNAHRPWLLNTALACAAAFIILYTTILTRTPGADPL